MFVPVNLKLLFFTLLPIPVTECFTDRFSHKQNLTQLVKNATQKQEKCTNFDFLIY
jgi:hypothetical protein